MRLGSGYLEGDAPVGGISCQLIVCRSLDKHDDNVLCCHDDDDNDDNG